MNTAKAVRIFFYSLLTITVIGVAIFVFVIMTGTPTEDPFFPTERPLMLTESLVKAALDTKNVIPPTTLSPDVKSIDRQCWNFLKTKLARTNKQYRLEARLLPDNGPTGADQVLVNVIFMNVIFMDDSKAEMYFYNRFLSSCHIFEAINE